MAEDGNDSGDAESGSGGTVQGERVATFIRSGGPSEVGSEADDRQGAGDDRESGDGQGAGRRQTTIYLDADVKRRLKAYCSLEEVEMSGWVNDLVAEELEDWSPDL